jgi:mRNA interferase RelE/StbE
MSNQPYAIILSDDARDALGDLDKPVAERIVRKILWLARNADLIAHEMLTGEWHGYFRYRVGNYRIIYLLDSDERVIEIVTIGHRREIYD